MKMEQTECSETSAYRIQTKGIYPEESIQHYYYCYYYLSFIFGNTSLFKLRSLSSALSLLSLSTHTHTYIYIYIYIHTYNLSDITSKFRNVAMFVTIDSQTILDKQFALVFPAYLHASLQISSCSSSLFIAIKSKYNKNVHKIN